MRLPATSVLLVLLEFPPPLSQKYSCFCLSYLASYRMICVGLFGMRIWIFITFLSTAGPKKDLIVIMYNNWICHIPRPQHNGNFRTTTTEVTQECFSVANESNSVLIWRDRRDRAWNICYSNLFLGLFLLVTGKGGGKIHPQSRILSIPK